MFYKKKEIAEMFKVQSSKIQTLKSTINLNDVTSLRLIALYLQAFKTAIDSNNILEPSQGQSMFWKRQQKF
jgi:hypothetical protein